MKKIILAITILGTLTINSCTNEFGEINTDPKVVSEVDVAHLLAYSLNQLEAYRGGEWIWEEMEQTFRYSQLMSANQYDFERNNINNRYGQFYGNILPNLVEIRRLIEESGDPTMEYMKAVTYIPQVYHALRVSDVTGDMPYTEAVQARYTGKFDPKYDEQEDLYNLWLEELDGAIAVLSSNLPDQVNPGTSDIYYQGEWENWVKLANALKLRIATRYENQNSSKAEEIFNQVMSHPVGPIDSDVSQMEYHNTEYSPMGNDVTYRSTRFANEKVLDFMKATMDPRMPIYYESNSLVGDWEQDFNDNGVTIPSFIDPSDPYVNYQGIPINWSLPSEKFDYTTNAITIGDNVYTMLSPVHSKFFSPRRNGGTGYFMDVMVSHAEVSLIIAEFLEKGYGSGSIEDYYNEGIRSSMRSMNRIALAAESTEGLSGDGSEIDAYLEMPMVKLDGTDNLEKIYIQQLLNFNRNATEAFTLVRRTGFPYKNSTLLPWSDGGDELFPRRFWTVDPGEVNEVNWEASLTNQDFTKNDFEKNTLNVERLWFDKTSPAFGEGN